VSDQSLAPEAPVHRIVIQGASGSGKTTLAAAIAARLAVPHLELDSLFHQPNWTPLELETFRSSVEKFTEQPHWVIDGNYSHVRDIVWLKADVIAFLDLPKSRVMYRVVKRTMRRLFRREELWNGNRESIRNVMSLDPAKNIMMWSWTTHAKYHQQVPEEARVQADHAKILVLPTTRAVTAFLASVHPTP
jgi:adenylate kinase family enzyme